MPDDFGDMDFTETAPTDAGNGDLGAGLDNAAPTHDEGFSDRFAPGLEPPISWPAERKARWLTLSREDQEFFATREREAHSKITSQGQELAQLRQEYERLNSFDVDGEMAKLRSNIEAEVARYREEIAQRDNQAAFEKFARQGREYLLEPEMQAALAQEMRTILAQVPSLRGEILLELSHNRLYERAGIPQRRAEQYATEHQRREQEQRARQEEMQRQEQQWRQRTEAAIEDRDRQWSQLLMQERAQWTQREAEARAQSQKRAEARWAKKAATVNVKSSPGHSTNPKTIDATLREVASRLYQNA